MHTLAYNKKDYYSSRYVCVSVFVTMRTLATTYASKMW